MLGLDFIPNLQSRYNIAPMQDVAVLRSWDYPRRLEMLRWGLVASWAKDPKIGARMINARAETVSEKPSFRAAFRRRRCLIPADGFYEWTTVPDTKRKQPWHIHRPGDEPFAFAGLWESWEGNGQRLTTFTIITTQAPPSLVPIHHRVPVILVDDAMEAWMTDQSASSDCLTALPDGMLIADPVSRRVNHVANDGPECLAPPEDDRIQSGAVQGNLFS